MRLSNGFKAHMVAAWIFVGLGVIGVGALAYAQSAGSTVPAGENRSSIHSRIGQTMRGQGPTDTPEAAMTVKPGSVPVGENRSSAHSRIGQTMRGHGPTDTQEAAMTIQPGSVPVGENRSSMHSRIGQTMRGQGPTDTPEAAFPAGPVTATR